MPTVEEWRQFAGHALALASEAKTPGERALLEEVALAFNRLAQIKSKSDRGLAVKNS